MSAGALIEGFDFVAMQRVSMTAREWREKYPPELYESRLVDGDTIYSRPSGPVAAEAYDDVRAVSSIGVLSR